MEIASYPAIIAAVLLLLGFIALGFPIFLSLGVSSVVGILIAGGSGGLGHAIFSMYRQLCNFILVAIPLYILLGEIFAHSGVGGDIYEALNRWLYRIPGGLAIASIYTCAVFGAMCGVSIAGVAAIAPVAVPEMIKRGYDRKLAAGSVTAAGALCFLIPPSVAFIVYGSIAFVSVGKLFVGGIVPGLVLATMMAIYVLIRVRSNPSLAPRIFETMTWRQRLRPMVRLWPALIIVFIILGGIYFGIATPTEIGALAVLGALLVAKFVYRSLNWKAFHTMITAGTRASVSLLVLCACALAFGNFLAVMRIPEVLAQACTALPIPPLGIVFIFGFGLIVGGMFIDGFSLILITTPILLPAIVAMGFDPLWYGVVLMLNLEMAVITPPVGLNLYTMKSVVPELDIETIIRGALPYVGIEFLCFSLFVLIPELVLWLPNRMG